MSRNVSKESLSTLEIKRKFNQSITNRTNTSEIEEFNVKPKKRRYKKKKLGYNQKIEQHIQKKNIKGMLSLSPYGNDIKNYSMNQLQEIDLKNLKNQLLPPLSVMHTIKKTSNPSTV